MLILIVDDDYALGGLFRDALQACGHEVHLVPTSESGVAALLDHRYDVLLLDLDLGATRGEGLIQRMRNLSEPIPPVIILSGQPPEILKTAAETISAAAVLRKPCTMDDLLVTIERACSERPVRGS
jgi:DNA-binding response OmpR family regulator